MKKIILASFFVGASALLSSAQVVVNEYSCANWKQFTDNYGKHEDWIELHNPSFAPVDISGYFLSDDEDEPTKWKIPDGVAVPANGYLLVYASGRNEGGNGMPLHTNFRLAQTKNNPEHVVFSKPNGQVINDLEIVKTKTHQSVGRLTNGSAEWRVFTQPTPGSSNNSATSFLGFAARPAVNQEAGFYQGSVTVALSTTEPNSVIRYTTDGTEPDELSPIYDEPLVFTETTVLKAVTFSNNPAILPSFVQYNTYFINVEHSLIVVSIGAEDVQELANGDASLRPVGSIEYFGYDGDRKARTYGELNEHGQDSWANDQRSMDWISRDEFGYNNAIKEKIFVRSERDEFQRLILRAAGDDNYPAANHPQNKGSAHIRDAYVHDIAERGNLHVDVRRSEKCIIYLNGDYWGVYDLRERPDDHDYTDFYYNQGKYDIQFIKTWGNTWAEYGGQQALDDWEALYDFIQNNDMADPNNFKQVAEQYDYESLVDYVIINSFSVCSDWLNWNTGWWRGFNPDGEHQKWGYILWDNDATFAHYINYTGIPDTSPYALPCNPEGLSGWQDPEGHIKVLNKLRDNPTFDQYYITRQADLWNTVLNCENMLGYLDSIIAKIQPEMQQHADRWDGDYQEWLQNANELRHFISIRCEEFGEGLLECYDLDGPYATVLLVEPPGAGSIKANTLTYSDFPVNTAYLGGVDLKLAAIAQPNSSYEFEEWTATYHSFDDPTSPLAKLDLTSADTIIAHFKSTSATNEPGKTLPTFAAYPTLIENDLTLDFYLPEKSQVSITLHSVLGDVAATLLPQSSYQSEGRHTLNFDLEKYCLPPGIYSLRFAAGGFEKTVKLVRVK
jgi:hypothetical protein